MELTALIHTIGPGLMVLIGILTMVLLALIFWPGKGLLTYLARIRHNQNRVILEDALKYLFDCEYKSLDCQLNSIAGNLGISSDRASTLVERLFSMGLVNIHNQSISLTDTGRSYSLRVIRVHRIWEQYLASETGVEQTEWHEEADRMEHLVKQEEAEIMAAKIGHPVYDPHGDPIPSVEGELPAPSGIPLSHMKKGDIGRIVHVEDEPSNIFEQLTVLGIYPGLEVYVTDTNNGRITFVAEGEECVLIPLFAAQISVEPLSGRAPVLLKHELLSQLAIGETAVVAGISPNCRGQQRRRLMDLGIVRGSRISAVMKSPSNDPVGYRVMGTTIGIRKKQAEMIFIEKENGIETDQS